MTGIHWSFGKPVVDEYPSNKAYETYLKKLEELAKKVGYHGGKIDERLLKLSILIGAADVRGASPVNEIAVPNLFKPIQLGPVFSYDANNPAPDKYDEFEFPTKGLAARYGLLKYFEETRMQPENVEATVAN